jgi:hypothetical protein
MEKLLLFWRYDQHANTDNLNSTSVIKNLNRIFDSFKANLYWWLFTQNMNLVLKFITFLERIIILICQYFAPVPFVSLPIAVLRNRFIWSQVGDVL